MLMMFVRRSTHNINDKDKRTNLTRAEGEALHKPEVCEENTHNNT